ncbi:MAG: creatininase family protein [Gemmatimonadota bacterium]|nr:creatininase family protein [Gemmatimonadota bacterium]MDH5759492.1 creatininase family protein [Gemmatimonadota bacterium]
MTHLRIVAPAVVLAAVLAAPATAQQTLSQEELNQPRPIDMHESVWIEELTWMEVRDLMAAGKRTVIIPTGGIEQNGPYVATGKHNYVLMTACDWLARELGDALCAPIIKLVPEGDIDPPTGHMRYPGTISLSAETFEAVLDDVGSSLRAHGFEHIIYIGDSGGNQRGMANVAERLNDRWGGTVAHYIPEFYDNEGVERYMTDDLGVVMPHKDPFHDFYWLTAMQMLTDPTTVRLEERIEAGLAVNDGVSLLPVERTLEVGRKLMQWRVDQTAAAIRAAIGVGG